GSINSREHPAPRGTVVTLYVTGEGETLPAGITGSVTGSPGPKPRLPVSLTINDANAAIQFAGAAPGLVAGVMQVNFIVPREVVLSGLLRVAVKVGEATSQPGVNLWIQ